MNDNKIKEFLKRSKEIPTSSVTRTINKLISEATKSVGNNNGLGKDQKSNEKSHKGRYQNKKILVNDKWYKEKCLEPNLEIKMILGNDERNKEVFRRVNLDLEKNAHEKKQQENLKIAREELKKKQEFIVELERNSLRIFEKYSDQEISDKAKKYDYHLPKKISDIISLNKDFPQTNRGYETFTSLIDQTRFSEGRIIQYEKQLELSGIPIIPEDSPTWNERIQEMAVAAEISFAEYCSMMNLKYYNVSGDDPINGIDAIVNNKEIDVKARCLIGKFKHTGNLDKLNTDIESGEVVAFFLARKRGTSFDETECEEIGIFDPTECNPFLSETTKNLNYLNPCLFIHFDDYFGLKAKKEYSEISLEAFEYFLKSNKNSTREKLDRLTEYYGKPAVLETVINSDHIPNNLKRLFRKIQSLFNIQKEHLAVMQVYDWIIQEIKNKKIINIEEFEEFVFPFCRLSKRQNIYIKSVLKVSDRLDKFTCKFTNLKFIDKDCEIIVDEGNGSIYAKFRNQKKGNTLFTQCWVTGEDLIIGDPGIMICNSNDIDKPCACLTHETKYKGKIELVGRKKCPENGREGIMKRRKSGAIKVNPLLCDL